MAESSSEHKVENKRFDEYYDCGEDLVVGIYTNWRIYFIIIRLECSRLLK